MTTRAVRVGRAVALTAGLLAGCQSGTRRLPYSDNPLLMSRQPLLQTPNGGSGERLAQIAQAGPRTVVPPPVPLPASPPPVALARTGDVPPPAPPWDAAPPAASAP